MKNACLILLTWWSVVLGAHETVPWWGPVASVADVEKGVMSIGWRVPQASKSRFEIWDDQGIKQSNVVESNNRGICRVMIEGLNADSLYNYRVCSEENICSDVYSFRTPPTLGEFKPFTFLVYGDAQLNNDVHKNVANAMARENASFAVLVGDAVETPTEAEWTRFFECARSLLSTTLFYSVLGNHEQNSNWYYDFYEFPKGGGKDGDQWWAFWWGDVLFVGLDSNLQYLSAANFALFDKETLWLETVLAKEARYKFVFFHHPPFCSHPWANIALAATWAPLFEQYHVTAVFSGHIHFYEHLVRNTVHYFVTGGGSDPTSRLHSPRADGSVTGIEGIPHYLCVTVDFSGVTVRMVAVHGPKTTVMDTLYIFPNEP
ncbi:MAG: metallophosphoesterase family protein [Methanomassiliicoccales archaeon]|nr:metallophosphoesterase family protein [Methanomassiliicoccales archaeon]